MTKEISEIKEAILKSCSIRKQELDRLWSLYDVKTSFIALESGIIKEKVNRLTSIYGNIVDESLRLRLIDVDTSLLNSVAEFKEIIEKSDPAFVGMETAIEYPTDRFSDVQEQIYGVQQACPITDEYANKLKQGFIKKAITLGIKSGERKSAEVGLGTHRELESWTSSLLKFTILLTKYEQRVKELQNEVRRIMNDITLQYGIEVNLRAEELINIDPEADKQNIHWMEAPFSFDVPMPKVVAPRKDNLETSHKETITDHCIGFSLKCYEVEGGAFKTGTMTPEGNLDDPMDLPEEITLGKHTYCLEHVKRRSDGIFEAEYL